MKDISQADLLKRLLEMVEKSSQSAVARELGTSPQRVNDMLKHRRNIPESLAIAMGFTREVKFRKIA